MSSSSADKSKYCQFYATQTTVKFKHTNDQFIKNHVTALKSIHELYQEQEQKN